MGSKKKEKEGGWLVEPLRVGVGTVVGVPSSWELESGFGHHPHPSRARSFRSARSLSCLNLSCLLSPFIFMILGSVAFIGIP